MAIPIEQREKFSKLASDAGDYLEDASAEEILAWAFDTFGDQFCVASSMADALLIHLASSVQSGVDVVFLDTGYHFAETLATRSLVADRYSARVVSILPKQSVAEQDQMFGERLHDRDPDACCNLRKVEPLRRALEPYFAWASGIRRDETPSRRTVKVVEWDASRSLVKVNPIATWTSERAEQFIKDHGVLLNPLLHEGYQSIGCAPCTKPVQAGQDPRSGRWANSGKTECGLHIDANGRLGPKPAN